MNTGNTNERQLRIADKPMKIKMSLILVVALAASGICRAEVQDAAKTKAAPAGGMKAVANAAPEEIAAVIEFNSDTTLPQAVQTLARSAGINIQFDPVLINATKPDGTPMPAPVVNAVRWENITPKQALNALLDNYNWRLVQDVNTGISRVTRKDTNSEPMITTVVQLSYASPTNIAHAVTNTLSKTSRIIPDLRTSQIIVLTQEKELEGLIALIKKLDRPTKQVLIEAKIMETVRNPSIDQRNQLDGYTCRAKLHFRKWSYNRDSQLNADDGKRRHRCWHNHAERGTLPIGRRRAGGRFDERHPADHVSWQRWTQREHGSWV